MKTSQSSNMRRHENSTNVAYNTTFFVTLFEELENIVPKMMQVMKKQVHKTQSIRNKSYKVNTIKSYCNTAGRPLSFPHPEKWMDTTPHKHTFLERERPSIYQEKHVHVK